MPHSRVVTPRQLASGSQHNPACKAILSAGWRQRRSNKMEDDGKKINSREFMGQIGISMTPLGAFSARPRFAAGNRVLQANDRIRVGLIGAGDRGQKDLKHLLKQPNVECVAIADVYSRRCEEV